MAKSSNQVKLTAKVGRIQTFTEAGQPRVSLSVLAETKGKDKDGKPVITSNWYLVKGAVTPEVFRTHPDRIGKDCTIELEGVVKEYAYTDHEGNEHRSSYIEATKIRKIS